MSVLNTPEDWWAEYAAIADDVKGYIGNTTVQQVAEHPLAARRFGGTALAAMGERPDGTVAEAMDALLAARDPRLATILNSIWVDAPDSASIHSWPSWGRFCDLCSEAHVLTEIAA